MKKLKIIQLIFLSLILNSCHEDIFEGSGFDDSELRILSDFDKISVEGVFEINIEYGPVQEVEIIADSNILSRIETEVINNQLYIEMREGNYRDLNIEINITTPDIERVKFQGVGAVNISNFTDLDYLEIINSGTGSFNLITGNTNQLRYSNEGSGDLMSSNFEALKVQLKNVGSGNSIVSCVDELHVELEGSGNVYYYGTPILNVMISGSGKVIPMDD